MFLSKKKIEEYRAKIQDFSNNPSKYNLDDRSVNDSLWQAKYGMKSAINSETGKIIPLPARMCCFVAMNVPIAFGLICMSPTMFNIVTFNVINQTYNAMMNYANGSGTEDSIRYTTISFTLAVVTSITTGFYLKKRFDKGRSMNIVQEGILRILPSGIAGFLNLFFMRSDYFTKGIMLKDENGNNLAISRRAGIKAVLEGGLTRIFLPLPLLVNHFLIKAILKLKLPRKVHVFTELFLCSLALGVGLPFSIAIFKQHSKIKKSYLEDDLKKKPEFANMDFVYYNKGL
jgi:hypothetical protein